MLVFTRRRGERIMIGDALEVVVLRVGRDGVRLGIVAPPEIPVHRKEVYDQIRDANRRAASSAHPRRGGAAHTPAPPDDDSR